MLALTLVLLLIIVVVLATALVKPAADNSTNPLNRFLLNAHKAFELQETAVVAFLWHLVLAGAAMKGAATIRPDDPLMTQVIAIVSGAMGFRASRALVAQPRKQSMAVVVPAWLLAQAISVPLGAIGLYAIGSHSRVELRREQSFVEFYTSSQLAISDLQSKMHAALGDKAAELTDTISSATDAAEVRKARLTKAKVEKLVRRVDAAPVPQIIAPKSREDAIDTLNRSAAEFASLAVEIGDERFSKSPIKPWREPPRDLISDVWEQLKQGSPDAVGPFGFSLLLEWMPVAALALKRQRVPIEERLTRLLGRFRTIRGALSQIPKQSTPDPVPAAPPYAAAAPEPAPETRYRSNRVQVVTLPEQFVVGSFPRDKAVGLSANEFVTLTRNKLAASCLRKGIDYAGYQLCDRDGIPLEPKATLDSAIDKGDLTLVRMPT